MPSLSGGAQHSKAVGGEDRPKRLWVSAGAGGFSCGAFTFRMTWGKDRIMSALISDSFFNTTVYFQYPFFKGHRIPA